MRHFLVGFGLLAGLLAALSAVPGRAEEKAAGPDVEKLVQQLASGRFAEREKAQKKLDEIGLPALAALKKAAETGDPETKRRAGDLIAKLEKQLQTTKVLAPTKLKLSYKDTPLKEALADFSKKSGYNLMLLEADKLKDRKITLETSETTFWQAFDQFCEKAGLVEAEPNEGQPIQPGVDTPFNLVPVQIQPGVIIKPAIIRPAQVKPLPANKPAPDQKPAEKKDVAPEKLNKAGALQVQVEEKVQVQVEKPQAAPAQKVQAAPAQAAPPQKAQPALLLKRPFIQPQPGPQTPQNQITLKDGKSSAVPTDYSGAVRVKLMDSTKMFGAASEKEILLGLRVSPEPKIRWQQTVNVRIDKAIDDQGQALMQAMGKEAAADQPAIGGAFPGRAIQIRGGWGFNGGFPGIQSAGAHQQLPVRLTKGEKPSKSLKELTGSITAQVLTEAEVHITVDDITKAAGKTVKGKESGSIKVNGFEEKNGQIIIRAEIDQPKDVVPAGQGNFNPFGGFNGGGIRIMPAPAQLIPQALPVIPGGALQVQAAPGKVQVQAVQVQAVQVQIQIGGGVIIGGPGGFNGGGASGLELLDEKGNVIPLIGQGINLQGGPGAFVQENHLTFQPKEGQKAAKLVFKGSKIATVEIPFSLKDVKLP